MSDNLAHDMLLVKEVAGMLRLALSTVYQLIESGKLPAYKLGGTYRVRKSDVESFLDSSRVEKQPKRTARARRGTTNRRTLQELDTSRLRRAWSARGAALDDMAASDNQ